MAPLDTKVVDVESLHKIDGQKPKNKKVKKNPGNEEPSLPFPHSMTGKTEVKMKIVTHIYHYSLLPVAHCWEWGKEPKKASKENNPFTVGNLICDRHGDQSDSSNQVTYVKEEKASKQRISGPQDFCRLLWTPDGP